MDGQGNTGLDIIPDRYRCHLSSPPLSVEQGMALQRYLLPDFSVRTVRVTVTLPNGCTEGPGLHSEARPIHTKPGHSTRRGKRTNFYEVLN